MKTKTTISQKRTYEHHPGPFKIKKNANMKLREKEIKFVATFFYVDITFLFLACVYRFMKQRQFMVNLDSIAV